MRFRAQVCSGLIPEIAGSNTAEGTGVPILLGALAELRKPTINFVMAVCSSARNNFAPIERIFKKVDILIFLGHLSREFKFH